MPRAVLDRGCGYSYAVALDAATAGGLGHELAARLGAAAAAALAGEEGGAAGC
jgi:hypothetical protein